ncbi:hypothetical protein [Streptomyces sp. NPDC058297]|uniref:hypothetical protein n=1 Tax=Streptomyces sp. NPDC058297 TaxID=3346433 RepID=UPI0036EE41AD
MSALASGAGADSPAAATTGEGALTVPAGATSTWGVDDQDDSELTALLTVSGTAASSWHILWTTR